MSCQRHQLAVDLHYQSARVAAEHQRLLAEINRLRRELAAAKQPATGAQVDSEERKKYQQ